MILFNEINNKQIKTRNNSSSIVQFIYYYFMIFLGFIYSNAYSQSGIGDSSSNLTYEMLRSQIEVFQSYLNFDNYNKNLLIEADSLASLGEYEIGTIYLEELLSSLRQDVDLKDSLEKVKDNSNGKSEKSQLKNYNISVITGADFDRHEFEYEYEQSDSTILEEISKPYIGINTEYVFQNTLNFEIDLYNSVKYNKEYLRDDYQLSYRLNKLKLILGGYYNKSFDNTYSSYWEHKFIGTFSSSISSNAKIYFRENFNYKTFSLSEYTYTDFYRNYFETLGELNFDNLTYFIQYNLENNEYLGNNENDYQQHRLRIGYKNLNNSGLKNIVTLEGTQRNYELAYGDSSFSNIYNQILMEAEIDIRLSNLFELQVEDNFIDKLYNNKSTFEPDYIWNYLRPTLNIDIMTDLQFGMGYEWEVKSHSEIEEDGVSSKEQDYHSNGIFSSLNYFSESGSFLSFSISYQWRRYADSPTNDLINLYSSRNIMSLMISGYFPVYNNVSLSILGMYDNDNDIDNDQGRTQSTIFNIELEYSL